jgi:hypothetical protein
LDKPIPDVSYPNVNSTKQVQKRADKRVEEYKKNIQSLNVGETK